MRLLERICPHWFGWVILRNGRTRLCRVCAQPQWRPDTDTPWRPTRELAEQERDAGARPDATAP